MGYAAQGRSRNDYPGKLDNTYAPVSLWLFDGDLVDKGLVGEDLNIDNGTPDFVNVQSSDKASIFMGTAEGLKGTDPAPAALRIAGDVTVQHVYTPTQVATGTSGTALISCDGQSASSVDNQSYTLSLASALLSPIFSWEHGANVRVNVTNAGFNMAPGVPHHIVGRRFSLDGGTTYTGELWVDGVLIDSLTGQTPQDGGASGFIYLGRNSVGQLSYSDAFVHAVKVIDRKLTDDELLQEFRRTGLASVLS